MSTKLLSFKQAVRALHAADLIVMSDLAGDRSVADTVGWANEGDEDSDFVVGAEGWDDVYLTCGKNVIREGNTLKIHGHIVVLKLYKEKR